jgi:hypothetical protein
MLLSVRTISNKPSNTLQQSMQTILDTTQHELVVHVV